MKKSLRQCGILLAVSSLPSKYGIGTFSSEAYDFVDFLKKSGQSLWQILPLGPTGYGDSPYQSFSTFAGNPYFISLEELIEAGLLTQEECDEKDFGDDPVFVDYGKMYLSRYDLLRKAYERSNVSEDQEFVQFLEENSHWVKDYAIFMALKDHFEGRSWDQWPDEIRKRTESAMEQYRAELSADIEYYEFIQYIFTKQWNKLKSYANENGIQIIGDIPIYVAYDSADTWANPELFQLDKNYMPKAVAGCPPDGFAADGQLWGNPLYRWGYHKKTGYAWWISRLAHCYKRYDMVRIDHFRGFDEYFSIPYGDKTAHNGHWEKGPGMSLFRKVKKALGEKEVIAEGLGYVTDTVRKLVKDSGFPGMKVLEFAFDSRDTGSAQDYLPHNYITNSVVYTGTHDNATLTGWFQDITDAERHMVREYLNNEADSDEEIYWDMVCTAMRSVSKLCVIPMQDYFGYGNETRLNQPSTTGKNWKWRLKEGEFSEELVGRIHDLTKRYGR